MNLLVELPDGMVPAPARPGSGRRRWREAYVYAAICVSIATLVAAVLACVDAGESAPPPASGRAQVPVPLRLAVAPIVEVDSPGQADCRVSVGPAERLPPGAHIRVRGLPAGATLSSGQPDPADQATAERTWVVPLQGVADLKIEVSRGVSGSAELHVALLDDDGRVVAERSSVLRIGAPVVVAPAQKRALGVATAAQAAPPPEKVVGALPANEADQPQRKPEEITKKIPAVPAATPDASPSRKVIVASRESATDQLQRKPEEITTSALSPSGPGLPVRARPATPAENGGAADQGPASPEDLAQAERLVAKGERYLAQGNVAVAREYFQRAVNLGLPVAALKMAETLDPRELAIRGVQGVKPDLAEARRWYQRALERNVPEADARLRRLGSQ